MNAPAGFTVVTSTSFQDASGGLATNATIYFQPVDNKGTHISFRAGGAGGQVSFRPVQANVMNGAFSIVLADTTLTTPVNVGYSVTCFDNNSGHELIGPGYGCIQPSGPTWNFDTFVPNTPAQQVVYKGADGASAYETAVLNGYVGTEAQWLTSLQGAVGAPGQLAAGSFSPNAFTEAIGIPSDVNVCDPSQLSVGQTRNPADGTLITSAQGTNRVTTGLMRAFGATQAISNVPVRDNSDCNVCLYDATGKFMRVQAMPIADAGNSTVNPGTVFALDGDQNYFTCCWDVRNYSAGVTNDTAMFFVGTTANPPALPANGAYVSFDYVANKINAALDGYTNVATLQAAIDARLPSRLGVNQFDYRKAVAGYAVAPDGTLAQAFDVSATTTAAQSIIHSTGYIPCAGMQNFSTNIPFITNNNANSNLVELDANFNLLSVLNPSEQNNNRLATHVTIPLSGQQSYIRGSYALPNLTGAYAADGTPGAAAGESEGTGDLWHHCEPGCSGHWRVAVPWK